MEPLDGLVDSSPLNTSMLTHLKRTPKQETQNGFGLSCASMMVCEIIKGGLARDGIASIDEKSADHVT